MGNIFDIFKALETKRLPSGPPEYLIAGLGNPGARYRSTRHNTGFLALDYLAEKYGASVTRSAHHALCGECEIAGHRVLLMKPQTYMNESGVAVSAAASFFRIPPENILILSDDISLVPGKIRIRLHGSCGGQNGLRSITDHLGTETFPRIRIGIGKPTQAGYDLADYVLGVPEPDDKDAIAGTFEKVAGAVECLLEGHPDEAMARYN